MAKVLLAAFKNSWLLLSQTCFNFLVVCISSLSIRLLCCRGEIFAAKTHYDIDRSDALWSIGFRPFNWRYLIGWEGSGRRFHVELRVCATEAKIWLPCLFGLQQVLLPCLLLLFKVLAAGNYLAVDHMVAWDSIKSLQAVIDSNTYFGLNHLARSWLQKMPVFAQDESPRWYRCPGLHLLWCPASPFWWPFSLR